MHFDIESFSLSGINSYEVGTVMKFTDYLQASLISFHLRALASSQPLPSTSLQHLEETESPLIRRHSDQGLPSPHWPASALQPCKKNKLINAVKFTLIVQFYFLHWLTLSHTGGSQSRSNTTDSVIVGVNAVAFITNTLITLYSKPSEALLTQHFQQPVNVCHKETLKYLAGFLVFFIAAGLLSLLAGVKNTQIHITDTQAGKARDSCVPHVCLISHSKLFHSVCQITSPSRFPVF